MQGFMKKQDIDAVKSLFLEREICYISGFIVLSSQRNYKLNRHSYYFKSGGMQSLKN